MKKTPKISVIIPLYVIIPRFFEDLKKFKKLNYSNYEILVVCDKKVNLSDKKIKVILTGRKNTGPAEKRDIALKFASGEICAFIDDDAYPSNQWLNEIVKSFRSEQNVVGVGGPGITPQEDNFWEKLGGAVYESIFASGGARDRFLPLKKRKYLKDWPAYNLAVRTNILKKVGGYGSSFYGGEDTFLCLKLIKDGGKILYNSKAFVYHHRRPLFKSHFRQIYNVGVHRGYFAKKFPETSRKFFYFIPSILTLGFFTLTALAVFNRSVAPIFLFSLALTLLMAFLSVRKFGMLGGSLASIGIIGTHLTYGLGFIRGLLTKSLTR